MLAYSYNSSQQKTFGGIPLSFFQARPGIKSPDWASEEDQSEHFFQQKRLEGTGRAIETPPLRAPVFSTVGTGGSSIGRAVPRWLFIFFCKAAAGSNRSPSGGAQVAGLFFSGEIRSKSVILAAPLPLPDSIPCSQAGQDGGIVDRRRPEFESRRGGFLFLLFLWRRAGHTGRRRKELRCRPILTTLSAKNFWRHHSLFFLIGPLEDSLSPGCESFVGEQPTGRKIETYHRYGLQRCSSGEEWWAHIRMCRIPRRPVAGWLSFGFRGFDSRKSRRRFDS